MTERERLEERLRVLEAKMSEPGFWEDSERAAKVCAEHAATMRKLGI